MATNVFNKAQEVRYWMERRFTAIERYPSLEEMRGYVERRWPDLLSDIREDIVLMAVSKKGDPP